MSMDTNEQNLRREAIQRRLEGQRPNQICRDLSRSRSWFDKWWAEYRHDPLTDFADRSRAPHHSPQQISPEIVRTIVSLRQLLEQATTPQTRYGLIGARAILARLKQLDLPHLPSLPSIQRILAQHHLTHPLGTASDTAFYPWPLAWDINAIFATDIITKHLRGGQPIQNFHTIDHFSHAVCLSQHLNKTSLTVRSHLLQCWRELGLPEIHQFDNEGAFCGGHTHSHRIGQVIRLCLFCGVEALFTPFYEPKRNHQIETFHSLWVQAFWSRNEFGSCEEVANEVLLFRKWYMEQYCPPALEGQTPLQLRQGRRIRHLRTRLERLIPEGRLPLSPGRFHFLRKVDSAGALVVLNERWQIGQKWAGEYVRATVSTSEQTIGFWHQADAESAWQLIKTCRFHIEEPIHSLRPEFYRKYPRCRDCLPG